MDSERTANSLKYIAQRAVPSALPLALILMLDVDGSLCFPTVQAKAVRPESSPILIRSDHNVNIGGGNLSSEYSPGCTIKWAWRFLKIQVK